MNDFGLFEEFLDDFLAVLEKICSSMIWRRCRRCFRRWWGAAVIKRRAGVGANAAEVRVRRWITWWTRCTRRWWSKWWNSSTTAMQAKMKIKRSSPKRKCCSFSSERPIYSKRRSLPKRNGSFASSMNRKWNKMKFWYILDKNTRKSSRNGKWPGKMALSNRRSRNKSDIVYELSLITRQVFE